jgi:hypothetical protein
MGEDVEELKRRLPLLEYLRQHNWTCGWRIVIPPKIPEDSPSYYHSSMRNLAVLFIHFIAVLARFARSWRRPFHRCGVASPQTPAADRESLQATIAESIRVGAHLCRLDGHATVGPSYSVPTGATLNGEVGLLHPNPSVALIDLAFLGHRFSPGILTALTISGVLELNFQSVKCWTLLIIVGSCRFRFIV